MSITFNNVSFSYYDNEILSNLTFSWPECGLIVILGKSGSGKSTLLALIEDKLKPNKGQIITDSSIQSVVFQSPLLLDYLNCEDNISLPLLLFGQKKDEEKISQVLKRVNLDGYQNKDVNELSGGEKVRVSIARALICSSKVLILDEPTGQLDKKNSEEIYNLLKELKNDRLIILVTHDEKNAFKIADFLYELKNKKLNLLKSNTNKNSSLITKAIKKKDLALKDGINLTSKYLKKKKHRVNLGIIFLSFMLSILYLGINISNNLDTTLNSLFSSYFTSDEYSIYQSETVQSSNHLSLEKNSIPAKNILSDIGINKYYSSLDYFLPATNKVYLNNKNLSCQFLSVIKQDESLISIGRKINSLNECIVNQTFLKEFGLDNSIIGTTFSFNYSNIIYSNKLNNADLYTLNLAFKIVGIVKEQNLFNQSTIYYSYEKLIDYLKSYHLDNISLELDDDIYISNLLESEEYREDDFNSQKVLFITDSISLIKERINTYYQDKIKITSKKLTIKESSEDIFKSLEYVIEVFLILDFITSLALEVIIVTSLYLDNIRFFALIRAFMDKKSNIIKSALSLLFLLQKKTLIFTYSFCFIFTIVLKIIFKLLSFPSFIKAFDLIAFMLIIFFSLIINIISSFIPLRRIKDDQIKKELEGED